MRRSYQASCRVLVARQLLDEPCPAMPPRMPSQADPPPHGLRFFRVHLEDQELSGLSLPRTLIGRSLVARCAFVGSDLSESRLCWSGFEDSDLSRTLLVGADLRASSFRRCAFDGADLTGADLRGAGFEGCGFRGARLAGARLTEAQLARLELQLDPAQREGLLVEEEGELPAGG